MKKVTRKPFVKIVFARNFFAISPGLYACFAIALLCLIGA